MPHKSRPWAAVALLTIVITLVTTHARKPMDMKAGDFGTPIVSVLVATAIGFASSCWPNSSHRSCGPERELRWNQLRALASSSCCCTFSCCTAHPVTSRAVGSALLSSPSSSRSRQD